MLSKVIPMPELRRQDDKNRQNSIDDLDPFVVQDFELKMQRHFVEGMKLYKEMLDAGVAKECARFVLPLATPTKLYMTGSVRSWIHYINLVLLMEHRKNIWKLLRIVEQSSMNSSLLLLKPLGGSK